jgi:hypothetical protein
LFVAVVIVAFTSIWLARRLPRWSIPRWLAWTAFGVAAVAFATGFAIGDPHDSDLRDNTLYLVVMLAGSIALFVAASSAAIRARLSRGGSP